MLWHRGRLHHWLHDVSVTHEEVPVQIDIPDMPLTELAQLVGRLGWALTQKQGVVTLTRIPAFLRPSPPHLSNVVEFKPRDKFVWMEMKK